MEDNSKTIATEVLQLLKREYNKAIKRLYILLIGTLLLLVISVVDSIYQRCRIIDILEEYEENCVEKVVEIQRTK